VALAAQNRIMKYLLRIPTTGHHGTLDISFDTEDAARESLAALQAHMTKGGGTYSFLGAGAIDTNKIAGLVTVVPWDDEA